MRVLYVSDLDGTLLNKNQELDVDTCKQINQLIDKGINFTISTGRGDSTKNILKDVHFKYPIMILNGTLNYDFDNKKYRNSQQVNESEKYYDDLMNKYLNGDPNTINQMKNVMKNLGLDENSLKDKSPDEINQYIDNLCNSFGISREQVDNLAKKFNFK